MEIEIFTFLLEFLDVTLKGLLIDNTAKLITGLSLIFSGAFCILVAMVFFNYWLNPDWFGNFMDLVKRMMVWAFLIGLAFNAGTYKTIATLLYGLGDDLGLLFLGKSNDAKTMFDGLIMQITSMGEKFVLAREPLWLEFERYGMTEIGPAFKKFSQICEIAFLQAYFNFCFIIIMIATFSTYVFAKLGLLLVLAVGPLFIGFALFPQTRTYAMNWVGQVLNYTMLTLFIAVLNSLLIALVTQSVDQFIMKNLGDVEAIDAAAWGMVFNITVLTVIIFLFIGKVPELASALTGGNAGTSGMGALGSSMRSFSKGGTMQKIGSALPSIPGGRAVGSAASSLVQNGAISSVAAILKKGDGAK